MTIRTLTIVVPAALALGLVACDSRDYEAEINDLQSQLSDAASELDSLRGENDSLTTEMEGLRAQAEETAAAAGALGEDAAQAVQTQLTTALDKASQTVDRLAALEREPDAPADARTEAVATLKGEVQEIVDSVHAAATELGLELQGGGVEPAAEAAAEEAEPAQGVEPAPEQPADEEAQQQQ